MAETKIAATDRAESLYERDFHRWTEVMAARLRGHDQGEIDRENVAEEIADLGLSVRREVRSRLIVLIAHLLKWQHQPALRTGSSWRATIRVQRREIRHLLDESPSLEPKIPGLWTHVYRHAVEDAADEMGRDERSLPVSCPYTLDQVLDPKFLPEYD